MRFVSHEDPNDPVVKDRQFDHCMVMQGQRWRLRQTGKNVYLCTSLNKQLHTYRCESFFSTCSAYSQLHLCL